MTILQPPALKIDEALLARGERMLPRCRIERRVVWNLLAHLAKVGFHPESVVSDEEVETPTPEAVMEELFSMDEGRIYFRKEAEGAHWVLVVLGNDGWDAVSDWSYSQKDHDGFNKAMEAFDGELYA